MELFKIKPLLEDAQIEDPRRDLKKAVTIEQFKAGEKALFFPDGFNWEYLPYTEIKAVIRARSLDATDRWLVKYAVEKPSIRVLFRDSFRLMIMEKDRNADTLAQLLKEYRDEAQAQGRAVVE
ncbi:MAG: hypothetical protein Q4F43_09370 [Eubacteriales bacterium]|nr:hypothetical protein [Eubacteriales bacterium]